MEIIKVLLIAVVYVNLLILCINTLSVIYLAYVHTHIENKNLEKYHGFTLESSFELFGKCFKLVVSKILILVFLQSILYFGYNWVFWRF